VCIMFPSFVLLFSCFWGKDLKKHYNWGSVPIPFFFVEDLLLVSTPGVCGLDNNEEKEEEGKCKRRRSINPTP